MHMSSTWLTIAKNILNKVALVSFSPKIYPHTYLTKVYPCGWA